jgi:filamentous hemagglutinin family protein
MKPRRFFQRAQSPFGASLRCGVPVFIGFTVFISGLDANAGDILRGGAGLSSRSSPAGASSTGSTSPASANIARANAADALARTTRAIDSVRALQVAARAAATANTANHLGVNPSMPSVNLPVVPNGLGVGGLQATANPNKWAGANNPTQVVANGRTEVTIKQTTQQALLNWQTFNIGKETTLTFDQSAAGENRSQWIAFNKVSDPSGNPSQILGSIKADGQVYVINPNGVIFGGTSQVNARGLTVSSLPINDNLVSRGLLNNPDSQFLFSGLSIEAGTNGTPAFVPELPSSQTGRYGDVTVQEGAILESPSDSAKVGGRIMLIGPNVTNRGSISTPDGQTILAAGLQVGLSAHASSDASLRGLDVFIGAVTDPLSSLPTSAGTATNQGLINIPRANVTIAGKAVNQWGMIDGSTSVSLNGRIDLLAEYGAISNTGFSPSNSSTGLPFVLSATGTIDMGPGSVTRILPEWSSNEKVIGSSLALSSQIRMEGQIIHAQSLASVFAPNADITLNSGTWDYIASSNSPRSRFVQSGGQIYLDAGSSINVAGSTDVEASVSENIVAVQLRGAELADSPLLREGALRGMTLYVNALDSGVYDAAQWAGTPLAGKQWFGTPLANVSGYIGLIQRNVGQLTTTGGRVNLASGGSVVIGNGATVDVSGGWTNYQGATVQTSRVLQGNNLIDVSQAYPNQVYDGIVTGTSLQSNAKWNITDTFSVPFVTASHYQNGYISGGNGGTLTISAPAVALDGRLLGSTMIGERQRDAMPLLASLNLYLQGQQLLAPLYSYYSPTPPEIRFQTNGRQTLADPFSLDGLGNPNALRDDRVRKVLISTDLIGSSGFGNLFVYNPDGEIVVASGEVLASAPGGSINLSGANIDIEGIVRSAGGKISLAAYNISPTLAESLKNSVTAQTPAFSPGRGLITLGATAILDASGLQIDDRSNVGAAAFLPLVTNGGAISISGYNAEFAAGSIIDGSGGVRITPKGAIDYGKGGTISISAGQDLGISSVLGGHLSLGSVLRGYSGGIGGSLSILAPSIAIGSGLSLGLETLSVDAEFFNKGGFNSFSLSGIGLTNGTVTTPGVSIAAGTSIQPVVTSWLADTTKIAAGLPGLSPFIKPAGSRLPINISFSAKGSRDLFTGVLLSRGDLVVGPDSTVRVEPGGSISFKGDTVSISGSVFAPGGNISITGAKSFPSLDPSPIDAFITVDLASGSVISTAGCPLLTPDPFGRRIGKILSGGTVVVNGNIAAESGALIDVSGSSGVLDLMPGDLGLNGSSSSMDRSTTPSPMGIAAIPTIVTSNGGSIVLEGQQELFADATLIGRSGGTNALGGSIRISSGRFDALAVTTPADFTLQVSQHGPTLPPTFYASGQLRTGTVVRDSSGLAKQGMGYFCADTFLSSGCDSLTLGGNVLFRGPIDLQATRSLTIASGGVLSADAAVTLSASYVSLGTAFQRPLLPQDLQNPFLLGGLPFYLKPTTGTGSLTVNADLIDIGNLSLQSIGSSSFNASNGDIRGCGTFDTQGDIVFKAGQIYPTTDGFFQVVAYDSDTSSSPHQSSVTIQNGASRQVPLSAAGRLSIYASTVTQGGVLRAPFGSITIGWDGTGTAPVDYMAGSYLRIPTASDVVLQAGSVTSVSAVDPISGKSLTIPYGLVYNGNSWIAPSGLDITSGGLIAKGVSISASAISTLTGSKIDISGGGDLYAYRWVQGLGGSSDILGSNLSFAVVPSYASDFAPVAPFHSSSATDPLGSDPGYVSNSLSVGDKIYLQGGGGLPSGSYTLLPARYALLPGAYQVTLVKGLGLEGETTAADGSAVVSGYRYNALTHGMAQQELYSRFNVASGNVVRARAEYAEFSGNKFLQSGSTTTGVASPRLPLDAAQLTLAARLSMTVTGSVLSAVPKGGRGGQVDLTSSLDILIAGPGAASKDGTLVLDSTQLTSFGAQSLLIGGIRNSTTDGTRVNVTSNHISIDNKGAPLLGPDVILVANGSISFAADADLESNGILTGSPDELLFGNAGTSGSGDGVVVRVSADSSAGTQRNGLSGQSTQRINIASGVTIAGKGVIIDSSAGISFDPLATVNADTVSFGSGQISLELNNPGSLTGSGGLVLSHGELNNLQTSAHNLALASYSSIDIYGSGRFGEVGTDGTPLIDRISLHAGQIRGFNMAGGTATFAAKTISLDNRSNSSSPGVVASSSGILEFKTKTIELGKNAISLDQFTSVHLNSSGGIIATDSGSLSASGDLAIQAPLITTAKGVTSSWISSGSLRLTDGVTSTIPQVSAGLGGIINLQGSSILAASKVILPGGRINLHATTGDLKISGLIDASGYAQTFGSVTKYVDGGEIGLTADLGNLEIMTGGVLRVSANPQGGSAGTISASAVKGSLAIDGALAAESSIGAEGGTFRLDVGTLASTASINSALDRANFSNARSIRVRYGDIVLDGTATVRAFTLAADRGSILASGVVNSSGHTGGSIALFANGNVILASGSILNVAGEVFDNAGKGGTISLESGASLNGIAGTGSVDIRSGANLNLSIAARTASSAAAGMFSGTLHIRAPQNVGGTDLLVNPINGTITGASKIEVEGYRIYDLTEFGGLITSTVQTSVNSDATKFLGALGSTTSSYQAMVDRLLANNSGLLSSLLMIPGVEMINRALPSPLNFSIDRTGGSVSLPSSGGTVAFPTGTIGNNKITVSTAATIYSPSGTATALAANTPVTITPGSSITTTAAGIVTFASGTAGAIAVELAPNSSYTTTTTGGTSGAISAAGSVISLNTAATSSITLISNTKITLPSGTAGNNKISSTVAGSIIAANGVITALVANAATSISAGSSITLTTPGTIKFASGTGGAIPIALATGSITPVGPVTITPPSGNLILGIATSTSSSDWNLATSRFGPLGTAGMLTMRAAGNLQFYNALSDGFKTSAYTSTLIDPSASLPANAQSWSYRLTAGADLSTANFRGVQALVGLYPGSGSLQLGKNGGFLTATGGVSARTSAVVPNLFQVIRTGSGDITVSAGSDVQLLNQFATIYSAGTRIADPSLGDTFEAPKPSFLGYNVGILGVVQQTSAYLAQYAMAGGNVDIDAKRDIIHLTLDRQGNLVADSERQMPTNWLYRRGYVDSATGTFGKSNYGDTTSTTWWVDYSNFFEGIGALGGGNVVLHADRDVSNVDAVAPTNARMPSGTPSQSRMVENGGGDVSVIAGRNIDAGVYYVEKGKGILTAGNSIITNSTRSPSLTTFNTPSDVLDSTTWLPTTLFLGKGFFNVTAGGDVLLGPIANAFLMPQGYNNSYWYKSYFSTYAPDDSISVSSLGGSITFREGITLPGTGAAVPGMTPSLLAWYQRELLLTQNPQSASYLQPWLRLVETSVTPFATAATLLPSTLKATAFSGDINLTGGLILSPSATGTLDLLANGAINGLQNNGVTSLNGSKVRVWGSSTINLSDADPSLISSPTSPFAYQSLVGTSPSANTTQGEFLYSLDSLFRETGSTDGSLQTKQGLHTAGILHAADTSPLRLFAATGDISGLTLYSAKSAQISAGRDLQNIALYLQNTSAASISTVSSGRDMIAYSLNSPSQIIASGSGNVLKNGPLSGDIQISGPGSLEVLAGRNLDLGIGAGNADGTGTGITSIGNARNPYLAQNGASITAAAGIGGALSLDSSQIDFAQFTQRFVKSKEGTARLEELGYTQSSFDELDTKHRNQIALQVFFLVLRDAGRDHNNPDKPGYKNYDSGLEAIASLFPRKDWSGSINTESRDIRTRSGGTISLLAPGGGLSLASSTIGNPLAPPGVITESGGDILVFTKYNVSLGISRIFTLRGGNEIIWSSVGNIAAGSSSKTIQSAPPTRVLIDPQSADVKTDLAGLATGGGIGVLSTVAGVKAGNVDLIAPVGTIDAGDAGIRVSGNLNIAAALVVNASNISVGGSSAGSAAPAVSSPSLGSISASSSSAGAAATSVASVSKREAQTADTGNQSGIPSIISVEVIGYGGGDANDEDENNKERNP